MVSPSTTWYTFPLASISKAKALGTRTGQRTRAATRMGMDQRPSASAASREPIKAAG